jgi:3-methyladenine DNA glycosylase AlkD
VDRIEALTAAFDARRDPDKAVAMAAYMKDRFPFLGIPSPERRVAQREALGDWRTPASDELSAFARACWARDEREFQYAGCDTLIRHVKRLGPDALDLCQELITTRPWWDTTDALATRVVAFHADRPTLERWLTSGNLWLERAVIIHQLGYRNRTDEAFLFHACLTHVASTEFFHRKAIGWALRQYARTAPDAVRRFVTDHDAELSGLSKREALKHL